MTHQQNPGTASAGQETVYREYPLDVQVIERTTSGGAVEYVFEAPGHGGHEFDEADAATLYADVYFDVNGFEEAGTGDRGVPPAIIQAGRDTLVAYFLTQSAVDRNWVASFYGEKPEKVHRYTQRVRKRAEHIRDGIREQGLG